MAVRDLLAKEQERGCLDGAMVSPLHGQMDTADQQAIFDRPPPGKRKILLSTQIAETSITIEDVTVVVDCGLIKIQTYDALNKVRMLAPTWCAGPLCSHLVRRQLSASFEHRSSNFSTKSRRSGIWRTDVAVQSTRLRCRSVAYPCLQ